MKKIKFLANSIGNTNTENDDHKSGKPLNKNINAKLFNEGHQFNEHVRLVTI